MSPIRKCLSIVFLCSVLWCGASQGDCIQDEGPYEDSYGWAIFPFYNSCDETFTISVCVKSIPPGSDIAVFNRYSTIAYGRGEVSVTGGKWDAFYSFRWDAGELVECPYIE
jgi:hypothetical protein